MSAETDRDAVMRTDYGHYRRACRTFGVEPRPYAAWAAHYADQYQWCDDEPAAATAGAAT